MIEILKVVSFLMAVHSLCAANSMHQKLPFSLKLEIVVMFGFAIGSVVSCFNADLQPAAAFFGVSLGSKVVSVIDLRLRGYSLYFSLISVERRNLQSRSA